MREILFRGKHKDTKEWKQYPAIITFGRVCLGFDLKKGQAEYTQIKGNLYDVALEFSAFIPETVDQYTGLTDKNGTKIFEGDIVKDTQGWIYEVKWDAEGYHSKSRGDTYICYVGKEPKSIIIGNIYDNPELLTTP